MQRCISLVISARCRGMILKIINRYSSKNFRVKPVKEFRSFFQVLCWLHDVTVNDHICLVHLDQLLLIIILAQHLKISMITIKKSFFFTYAYGFCWRHNASEPGHYLFLHSHWLLKFAFVTVKVLQ